LLNYADTIAAVLTGRLADGNAQTIYAPICVRPALTLQVIIQLFLKWYCQLMAANKELKYIERLPTLLRTEILRVLLRDPQPSRTE